MKLAASANGYDEHLPSKGSNDVVKPRFLLIGYCLLESSLGNAEPPSLPTIFSGQETLDPSSKLELLKADPAAKKMSEIVAAGRPKTLEEVAGLAGADRPRIIAILYEFLRDPRLQNETGLYFPQLIQALLQLGDERGMQLLAEKLRSDPEFRESDIRASQIAEAVERSGQPAVIPHLAPLLFINESPESDLRLVGDVSTGDKVSFQAGNIIQKVLERAEPIPLEVKEWSRRSRRSSAERGEYREILREWWKSNEDAFRRKDYAAVSVGREWPVGAAKEPAPAESGREFTSITTITAPVARKETPAMLAATPSETGPLWMLVGGAIVALVALASLLFFWRRRV